MSRHGKELVRVRLVGLPLDVYARVEQAHQGLMREFALISLSDPGRSVPARLVGLTKELKERYEGFARAAREQRAVAAERGDTAVDVAYDVPVDIAEAAARYDALLDEAVEYCRHGDLLTLAPSDEHIAFRRWFLGEFVRQVGGGRPIPWPEYAASASPPVSSRER